MCDCVCLLIFNSTNSVLFSLDRGETQVGLLCEEEEDDRTTSREKKRET